MFRTTKTMKYFYNFMKLIKIHIFQFDSRYCLDFLLSLIKFKLVFAHPKVQCFWLECWRLEIWFQTLTAETSFLSLNSHLKCAALFQAANVSRASKNLN